MYLDPRRATAEIRRLRRIDWAIQTGAWALGLRILTSGRERGENEENCGDFHDDFPGRFIDQTIAVLGSRENLIVPACVGSAAVMLDAVRSFRTGSQWAAAQRSAWRQR
jgi:hypothetical protein